MLFKLYYFQKQEFVATNQKLSYNQLGKTLKIYKKCEAISTIQAKTLISSINIHLELNLTHDTVFGNDITQFIKIDRTLGVNIFSNVT